MMEDKKEQFFARHMEELAERAYNGQYPVYSEFLTTREYTILNQIKKKFPPVRLEFYGGHEDCDHRICGFFPKDWQIFDFPVCCIRVDVQDNRYAQSLSHRDYLGAILNLGIERSKVGDIRICNKTAFVFCKEDFAPFIIEHFMMVKHTPVHCEVLSSAEDIPPQQFEEINRSIASCRLDNVVSAITGKSRGKAAELIRQGHVVAEHEVRNSVSYICHDEAVITIRGYGKYCLQIPEDSYTRKGKQKITIYKYI